MSHPAGEAIPYHDGVSLEPASAGDQLRAELVFRHALNSGIPCFAYPSSAGPGSNAIVSGGQVLKGAGAAGQGLQGSMPLAVVEPVAAERPALTAEYYEQFLRENELDDDDACIACMERARDNIILPCGHLVLCAFCCEGISLCPVCRGPVAEFMSIA